MVILKKLITALRGGINEMGESLVDSQALRILDQEIRDADNDLREAKESLANIMAQQKVADKHVDKTKAKIAEYENYAIKALDNKDEALALEVAEKIALLENELANHQKQADNFAQSVANLRQTISQTEINIRNLKQQVDIVKATESVQKAQSVVSQRYGGSTAKLQTALDSLDRIKQRQEKTAATIEAKNELAMSESHDPLEKKLKAAGISSDSQNAATILAKLKEKQTKLIK